MRLLPRFSVGLLLLAVLLVPAQGADVPRDWAYQKFTRPTIPPIKHADGARNEIDRFLLAKLEAKGLSFAPGADRRTLLRRVYFDLIGLPPSPEEVEAFVADKSPDAYEKRVDRLLASPQFGERMAEWWLDVARYAETDGFKADDPRPHAWRYRDYVIKSFNADKPFDRFIKEQLAGDELYPNDPDAIVATGFLRHAPYEYNAVDVETKRQDMLNDITDTTAVAFLGVTLGCARCHDHKTDPITHRDYYRVQAFFAGFWPVEVPVVSSAEQAEYARKLAGWNTRTEALRREMNELEKPVREKAMAKERGRFPEEYSSLIDIPTAKRTPLQTQLGMLVERQVNSRFKVTGAQMKPADREKWEGMAKRMTELEKDRPPEPPRAMAMTDLPVPPATKLLKRGNWRNPATDELVPGFITSIDSRDAKVTPTATTSGRRSALAEWVASKDNPLTARVIVNRLWQHHFGKGIVASPGDFGVTGDRPTHPELLAWLASELVNPSPNPLPPGERGLQAPPSPMGKGIGGLGSSPWSLKHVHRLMVTSAAYRQSAKSDAGAKADPENALLWHFPGRRLDGESLRDAMLAVAGRVNLKAGGPSVFPDVPPELQKASPGWKVTADASERDRRSVYVFVKRNLRYPLFALFDAPDRNETCSRRFTTTTAPQALTLLNDPIVLGFARSFALRVEKDVGTDPAKVVDRAFRIAFSRPPTREESDALGAFLKDHPGTSTEAITDLCHALLNLNEFLYVD